MNTGFGLEKAVREAREKTGVPGVAAGLLRDGEVGVPFDAAVAIPLASEPFSYVSAQEYSWLLPSAARRPSTRCSTS